MVKAFQVALVLSSVFFVASCREKSKNEQGVNPRKEALEFDQQESSISSEFSKRFPILPIVEKHLWRELLAAEAALASSSLASENRADAAQKIEIIAGKLRQRHPFSNDDETTRLGGITYRKATKKIEIFAQVHLPKKDQDGQHTELELILCSFKGRMHETLFVTEARPLHLELLLHLAGFKKAPEPSAFRISISLPNQDPFPVESLMKTTTGEALSEKIIWEFSGSHFTDLYPPDQTGDFILCWHAHDSVLQIRNHGIASGEIKLKAKTHPLLSDGLAVKLILTPVRPIDPTSIKKTLPPSCRLLQTLESS